MEDNKGGRPLKFKSAKDLEKKIGEYFDRCEKKGMPFTMSGLANGLDVDRKTLLNYGEREEFFPTIKRARQKVEQWWEERLANPAATGAIFNLKNNFDWKDKTEQSINVSGKMSLEGKLREVMGDKF
ncbi:hypothetical protein CE91St36_03200 [Christensenellaceae bacterium]|nr:hypothetical protein CE91St36_03200 [Christensenellaceae bacterium]